MAGSGGSSSTHLLLTLVSILSWYGSSVGVLVLNKYLLSNTGFRFPVFLTFCHMLASFLIGLLASVSHYMPLKPIKSKQQLIKVVKLSAFFCLAVVLGNVSLKFIPVSFNQAIGSTTPFFTAVLAYIMQGQREVPLTYYSLVPIIGGVVIASGGEPLFHAVGFTCALTATSLRALKSVVQALIMTDPSEKLDPMSLLVYMSGVSMCFLLPASAILEPSAMRTATTLSAMSPGFASWLLGNCSLAYLVNLTNFLVTKYTSALTLQVLGNLKGLVAAVVSVMIFRNVVTWQGAAGYAIAVAGVFLYSESKRRAKLAAAAEAAASSVDIGKESSELSPLLGGGTGDSTPSIRERGSERV